MIDPVRERQLQELDTVGICTRILYQARSELYVNCLLYTSRGV